MLDDFLRQRAKKNGATLINGLMMGMTIPQNKDAQGMFGMKPGRQNLAELGCPSFSLQTLSSGIPAALKVGSVILRSGRGFGEMIQGTTSILSLAGAAASVEGLLRLVLKCLTNGDRVSRMC